MFTLPTNRIIKELEPPPGKVPVPRMWNLQIRLTPGVIKDDQWLPNHSHPQLENPNLAVEISLGNKTLTRQAIKNSVITWASDQVDTATLTDQTIAVRVLGIESDFNTLDFNALICVDIKIENLPTEMLIEQYGRYVLDSGEVKAGTRFLGENGTLELPLQSPIYVWLMERAQFVRSI